LAAFCRHWGMSPHEVKAMRLDEYRAFVEHMQAEAKAQAKASKRRR